MTTNQYYRVTKPFRLYIKVGVTDSNTYVGRSQALGIVWQEIEAKPGAELHLLVGGDFYVTLDQAWECAVELSEKHPFEKVYLPRIQSWPAASLGEIPDREETFGFHWWDVLQKKYTPGDLKEAGASRRGRGIDYVIPRETMNYSILLEMEFADMASPVDAAKAMAAYLGTDQGRGVPGSMEALYYVSPVVDDGRIAKEAMVPVDLQNLDEAGDEADSEIDRELVLVAPDWSKLGEAARKAADHVALDTGNELVVLPFGTDMPGAQHDDNVTAIAAIDLLRVLVAEYEKLREES